MNDAPHGITLDDVDALGAGAIGEPGARRFFIQARKDDERFTVLVEKEQVALLAAEVTAFLDRLAEDFPEEEADAPVPPAGAEVTEPAVPLFRARMIGIGYEPRRRLVLLELREQQTDDPDTEPEGFVVRIFATRAQVRAMAVHGAAAVAAGRPACTLCSFPMDPDGHVCPRWN